MAPNQFGTWRFGRAGWCPGGAVRPVVIDVTAALRPGLSAVVTYHGLVNGSNYHPQPCAGDACFDGGFPAEIRLASRLVIYAAAPREELPVPAAAAARDAGAAAAAAAGGGARAAAGGRARLGAQPAALLEVGGGGEGGGVRRAVRDGGAWGAALLAAGAFVAAALAARRARRAGGYHGLAG